MNMDEGGRRACLSWRLYAAIAAATALSGCLTQSGPPLSALATAGGPPKGMARVVVMRQEPHSFGPRNRNFPVKLDGEPLGELSAGTFAYLDCPAGSHRLSADLWGWPGVTRRDFTAAPGRTYYFRASLHEKADDINAAAMISPIGSVIAASATYNDRQGPIDLTPMSEAEAKEAIAAAQAGGQ